jgi:E3 ubiquitin-protein ligase SIS3
MFFGSRKDLLILASCIVLGIITIEAWDQYASCYAPTQIFIIETIAVIFFQRIFDIFRKKSFVPRLIKNILTILSNVGMNSMFFYITIQGFIWQSMNASHEDNCAVLDKTSWAIWLLLGGLVLMDIGILFYAVSYIIVWKKFRDFRRRQAGVNDAQILNEYINGRVTQVFLSGTLSDDNERPGLTFEEIQRMPRKIHGECGEEENIGDSCPVCYEEVKHGEEICSLPGCGHTFHWKCIHGWFVISPLCPMCRSNVKYNIGDTPTSVVSSNNTFDMESQVEGRA